MTCFIDGTALKMVVPRYFSKNNSQAIQFYSTPDYVMEDGQSYLRLPQSPSVSDNALGENILDRTNGPIAQDPIHLKPTLLNLIYKNSLHTMRRYIIYDLQSHYTHIKS